MGTEWARFIRRGGHGAVTLRFTPSPALSVKEVAPVLRDRFAANLDRADLANADTVLRVVGNAFAPPLTLADMVDLSADKADALAVWEARADAISTEWARQPDRLAAARLEMEDDLLRAFAALANERRQAHLGIARYIWRSRDDARVRHAHAVHDDELFDWEEPPEDGHPGMAFGCRCWAEPVVEPAEPYAPLAGQALADAIEEAEGEGRRLATEAAAREVLLGVPRLLDASLRLLDLVDKEEDGRLTPAEAEDLARMRAGANARFDALEALLADVPGALRDVRAYRQDLLERARAAVAAYRAGRATEGQMRAAARDLGYADRSIALGVLGTVVPIALSLPSRGRIGFDLADREALRRFWADESGAMGPRTIGWDWAIRPNEGISWGGPIRLQGDPWEAMLDGGALGDRLPRTFPRIDFVNRDGGLVTSAKTLATRSRSYVDEPSRVFGRLRGYIDGLASFQGDQLGGSRVAKNEVVMRRLALAIPSSTTSDQMFHIQRAIDYGRSVGVELIVTRIN